MLQYAKLQFQGAREMAQWLRTFDVLAEDLGLVPGTLMVSNNNMKVQVQKTQSQLFPSLALY